MIKILFLAANPSDTTRLALAEEHRTIEEALQKTKFGDRFVTEQKGAVRVADLQTLLCRHTPIIVHFSGHGSQNHELIFLDNSNNAQPVSVNALSELFSLLKGRIRCVLLNACYSQQQAEAIAQEIDYVIGMPDLIDDEIGSAFAEAFYSALGNGENIEMAFKLGRNRLALENLAGENKPRLLICQHQTGPSHLFDTNIPPVMPPSSQQTVKWARVITLISSIVILTISVIAAYGIGEPQPTPMATPTFTQRATTAGWSATPAIVASTPTSPSAPVARESSTMVEDSPTQTALPPTAVIQATATPTPMVTSQRAISTIALPLPPNPTYPSIQLSSASENNQTVTLRWAAVALAPEDHYAVIVEHSAGWNWVITDATTWTSDKWLYDKKKNGGFTWYVAICRGGTLGEYNANPDCTLVAESKTASFSWSSSATLSTPGQIICVPADPTCQK